MAFEAIHLTVSDIARRYPDNVAVSTVEGGLSYHDLDVRSDHLAATLIASGTGVGCVVPVLAPDRRELAVAILAILKAGGVFVPLDCDAPVLRLKHALVNTAAEWVVLGTGVSEDLIATAAEALPSCVSVAVGLEPIDAPQTCRPYEPGPDDAAYIFFTSGSTGQPKGIVGRFQGIDHFIRWESELVGIQPDWRVSQLTSPAFDAMMRDLFVPLCAGATAVVPPPSVRLDPMGLARWIDREAINLVHCVPSVFRRIVETATAEAVPFASLRCIAMAGEPLRPADVGAWFDCYGGRVALVNLYGPSETTMTKTFHIVRPTDATRPSIPIGKPMPGVRAVVLDASNKPAAVGAVGEIYLRTPFMSLGYYHQPDATRAAFVPNPLNDDPDDIVYRTGDYGRLLADGNLEYVGRRDHQVKVGGVRVELGELEAALCEHPSVRDAAAVLSAGREDAPFLCAYIEAVDPVEPEQLRTHMSARFAESLVPSVFVTLDALPRTISGKIDRSALPAPALSTARLKQAYVAPRTPTEHALVALWSGMLPIDGIGIRHDFFEVGGHSLLVMRMLAELLSKFGVEVTLQEFLVNPTIESLAQRVEASILDDDQAVDDLLNSLAELDDEQAQRLLTDGERV